MEPNTVYELVGGQAWFDDLVERFYEGVASDTTIRHMYPDDLVESRRHLADFLAQYWGGPPDYSAERGHPRLRMRHVQFAIGKNERDAWFSNMASAVRSGGLSDEVEQAMLAYFDNAATHLINTTI